MFNNKYFDVRGLLAAAPKTITLNVPRACDVQAKEVKGKVNRNKLKTNNT